MKRKSSQHKPKVSVVAISFNQDKYIREALEGFVSQKTNFKYEIIISDDGSSDSTPKIIQEYTLTHPDIFKPIFHSKNVGIQQNLYGALRAASGEYIALCEGDDYWTDPTKLQTQANFLDKNTDHTLCFHPVDVIFEDDNTESYVFPDLERVKTFTLYNLLEENYIQTNSVMYRRQKYDRLPENILPLDWYLHLYHARLGKIGFLDNKMSVYRRHQGGVWWDSHKSRDIFWKRHGEQYLALHDELSKLFADDNKAQNIITAHIYDIYDIFLAIGDDNNKDLIERVIKQFPDMTAAYMSNQSGLLNSTKTLLGKSEYELMIANDAARYHKEKLAEASKELSLVKSSKLWRLYSRSKREIDRRRH